MANGTSGPSSSRPPRTDDQLIINYMNPGLFGWLRPPFIIFPTYMDKWTSPQDLCRLTPPERDSHRYFYVRRGILDSVGGRNDRFRRRGYWELANEDVEDISFNDRKIGEKRKLIYIEAKGSVTQWIMFEYKAIITGVPNHILHRAVYKLRSRGDFIVPDEGKTVYKLRTRGNFTVQDKGKTVKLSVGKVPNGTADVDGKKADEKPSDNEKEDESPVERDGDTDVEDDSDGNGYTDVEDDSDGNGNTDVEDDYDYNEYTDVEDDSDGNGDTGVEDDSDTGVEDASDTGVEDASDGNNKNEEKK